MKWLTNILNKFRKPEPEQEDFEDFSDPIVENDDIRATIDTAIHVYNWLEEIDLDGPAVLKTGMKRKLTKAKRQCLELVAFNIDLLVVDDEKKEDEEDE